MAMSRSKKWALAGSGAAVLALGVAAPAVAFANDPSPSPSASAGADREQRRAERQSKLAAALAKELGISEDKVAEALANVHDEMRADAQAERQEALKQRLDDAVKAGKLTQEQADAMLKAHEEGVMPGGPGGMGGRGGHGPGGDGPGGMGGFGMGGFGMDGFGG